ncbi:MAG: hypothetical protein V5A34_08450 [Halapricum sp.]
MKRREFITGTSLATVGLAGCIGPEHEFKITETTVEPDSTPFVMKIDVIDPDATLEGPAILELSVTNASDWPVRVRNRGVWPFGVVWMAKENPHEVEATRIAEFMSDAYEESEHVDKGPQSTHLDSTVLEAQLPSGQTASERYTVSGDDIPTTGEYGCYGEFEPWLFEFSQDDGDSWKAYLPKTSINVGSPGLL